MAANSTPNGPMDDNPLALALVDVAEADRRLAQAIITLMRHQMEQGPEAPRPSYEMTLSGILSELQFHRNLIQNSRRHLERMLNGLHEWSGVR